MCGSTINMHLLYHGLFNHVGLYKGGTRKLPGHVLQLSEVEKSYEDL